MSKQERRADKLPHSQQLRDLNEVQGHTGAPLKSLLTCLPAALGTVHTCVQMPPASCALAVRPEDHLKRSGACSVTANQWGALHKGGCSLTESCCAAVTEKSP